MGNVFSGSIARALRKSTKEQWNEFALGLVKTRGGRKDIGSYRCKVQSEFCWTTIIIKNFVINIGELDYKSVYDNIKSEVVEFTRTLFSVSVEHSMEYVGVVELSVNKSPDSLSASGIFPSNTIRTMYEMDGVLLSGIFNEEDSEDGGFTVDIGGGFVFVSDSTLVPNQRVLSLHWHGLFWSKRGARKLSQFMNIICGKNYWSGFRQCYSVDLYHSVSAVNKDGVTTTRSVMLSDNVDRLSSYATKFLFKYSHTEEVVGSGKYYQNNNSVGGNSSVSVKGSNFRRVVYDGYYESGLTSACDLLGFVDGLYKLLYDDGLVVTNNFSVSDLCVDGRYMDWFVKFGKISGYDHFPRTVRETKAFAKKYPKEAREIALLRYNIAVWTNRFWLYSKYGDGSTRMFDKWFRENQFRDFKCFKRLSNFSQEELRDNFIAYEEVIKSSPVLVDGYNTGLVSRNGKKGPKRQVISKHRQ